MVVGTTSETPLFHYSQLEVVMHNGFFADFCYSMSDFLHLPNLLLPLTLHYQNSIAVWVVLCWLDNVKLQVHHNSWPGVPIAQYDSYGLLPDLAVWQRNSLYGYCKQPAGGMQNHVLLAHWWQDQHDLCRAVAHGVLIKQGRLHGRQKRVGIGQNGAEWGG